MPIDNIFFEKLGDIKHIEDNFYFAKIKR
jgi:hypothetical protein